MPAHVGQAVAPFQLGDAVFVAADNGNWLAAVDNLVEQLFGQVRAGSHRQIERRARAEAAQDAAVVQR